MRLPFNLIIDRGSKISSVMPPHSLLNAELQGPLLQGSNLFSLTLQGSLGGFCNKSRNGGYSQTQRPAIHVRAETTFSILFTSTFNLLKQLFYAQVKKTFQPAQEDPCLSSHISWPAINLLHQLKENIIGNYVKGEWKCRGHKARRVQLQTLTLRFLSTFYNQNTWTEKFKKCTGSTHKIKHIKYCQRNVNWSLIHLK